MQSINLRNRLSQLTTTFVGQNDLGANSVPQSPGEEDSREATLLLMMGELFEKNDNREGVDLDPTRGQVRFTQDSLGGGPFLVPAANEVVGSYKMERQEGQLQGIELQLEAFGERHRGWQVSASRQNGNVLVYMLSLEDRGENFTAIGSRLGRGQEPLKVAREGSWAEFGN